jgi:formylglycine-generating enzyme required for sulfatase activity
MEDKELTYEEYRKQRENELNNLPIFYAFTNAQFKRAMEERGLTENDTDKLYKLGNTGGFYLKSDAPLIKKYIEGDKLAELMKDFEFAKSAIYYEMCNHEYGINWQGNYDVCNCFADRELPYYGDDYYGEEECKYYFDIMQWGDETRRAWRAAESKYRKMAEGHDWY